MVLNKQQLLSYVHMIPQWLLESDIEGEEVEFWGMEDWEVPCGVAVLNREDGVPTLKHLYVEKEYRESGRGSRFLTEILYRVYKRGDVRFQIKYIPKQYPELERLLRSYPMTCREEVIGSAFCTIKELAELKYLQGDFHNVQALSECTEESLTPLYQEIIRRQADLVELPLKKKDYLAEYSAVAMENGRPSGLLLVKEDEFGVTVPFLINVSENIAAPIEMIRFTLQKGSKAYPPETICRFAIVNESLLQILEKIGISTIQKRQCYTIELSRFYEYEQDVEAHIEVELQIRR